MKKILAIVSIIALWFNGNAIANEQEYWVATYRNGAEAIHFHGENLATMYREDRITGEYTYEFFHGDLEEDYPLDAVTFTPLDPNKKEIEMEFKIFDETGGWFVSAIGDRKFDRLLYLTPVDDVYPFKKNPDLHSIHGVFFQSNIVAHIFIGNKRPSHMIFVGEDMVSCGEVIFDNKPYDASGETKKVIFKDEKTGKELAYLVKVRTDGSLHLESLTKYAPWLGDNLIRHDGKLETVGDIMYGKVPF